LPETNARSSHRQLYPYFGLLALLVNLVNPQFVLDIPTSFMLLDRLHASAEQISWFRLVTGVPFFLGFAFGMTRDLWSPFGKRDPGYFRLFVPLMMTVLAWTAFAPLSFASLLIGMLLAATAYSFLSAAYQGLLALIGQEARMPGRLSTLSNTFIVGTAALGYFASGWMATDLSPREVFLLVLALTATLGIFGFWKPRAVFSHAYDDPRAQGTNFFGDVKRLVKHRAIYPVIAICLLWYFTPGANTPMQFYLSRQLHTSDAIYGDFSAVMYAGFLPTSPLYGFLCTKFPPRKLLWWSMIVGVP
jgi:Na+/melibiose symporter-like transporter